MPSFPAYLLSGGMNDPHKAMLGPDIMAAILPTSREDLGDPSCSERWP